eukprot:gene27020-7375_t
MLGELEQKADAAFARAAKAQKEWRREKLAMGQRGPVQIDWRDIDERTGLQQGSEALELRRRQSEQMHVGTLVTREAEEREARRAAAAATTGALPVDGKYAEWMRKQDRVGILVQPPFLDAAMDVKLGWLFRNADADEDGRLCFGEFSWLLMRAVGRKASWEEYADACAAAACDEDGLRPGDLRGTLDAPTHHSAFAAVAA